MRSLAEIYATTRCDKGSVHSYIEVYEEILCPYREEARNVLEIGIFAGESLRMWEEYFTNAAVWGIDLCDQPLGLADLRPLVAEGTHRIVFGDASDRRTVARLFGDTMFDVIIEDANHNLETQLSIYAAFRDRLTAGGLYVVEDVADLDFATHVFESIDPMREVTILDRREIKRRFDDVLVIVRG